MKAVVLTIGDELLIGQVVDTNSAWIGARLYDMGIQVVNSMSISDEAQAITEAINRAVSIADLVLITGGLGPTKDDITKKVLCQLMECELYFSDATYNRIQRMFQKRGIPMREAHKEQCMMPEKAEILINARGTAPGMLFHWQETMIVSMPGVPMEMKYLMTAEVLPRLEVASNIQLAKRTIRTAGVPESTLAEIVEPILVDHDVSVAYLPSRGQVRLRLYKESANGDKSVLQKEVDHVAQTVVDAIGTPVYGYDEDTLEKAIGMMLLEAGKTISTAESCTGGYLSHLLTSVAGASRYFLGSTIAYSNAVKVNQLAVKQRTLKQYGAVSTEVTEEMLAGSLSLLGTDVGIAVSGVAGPGGGSTDKPVGTSCITVGSTDNVWSKQILIGKDRITNIQYTAIYALNMLRKFLLAN